MVKRQLVVSFLARGAAIRGLRHSPSRFGAHPPALWLGRREIAHLHGDEVEVRLTRRGIGERRDELRRDLRIDLRRPGSDWVRLRLLRGDDVERALELLRAAIPRNRRSLGPSRSEAHGPRRVSDRARARR